MLVHRGMFLFILILLIILPFPFLFFSLFFLLSGLQFELLFVIHISLLLFVNLSSVFWVLTGLWTNIHAVCLSK